MKNPTVRQLEVFSAAARTLNFSKAAEELHLTQPAVSLQIRQLEAIAGLPLFDRLGRKLRLTEAGREVLYCAAEVDKVFRGLRENIDALSGRRTGTLRLGAVSTAKYFAPSLVSVFGAEHPEITVRFNVDTVTEVLAELASGEVDIGIVGRAPPSPLTIVEPFAPHPYIIFAPPSHPLAKCRQIPPEALAGERFLTRKPGCATRMLMDAFFRDRNIAYNAAMQSNSNETIKQAVIAGMGIGFLSMHTASFEIATGRLVPLDVRGLPVTIDWCLVYLRERRLPPIAAAFREFLLRRSPAIIIDVTGISPDAYRRSIRSGILNTQRSARKAASRSGRMLEIGVKRLDNERKTTGLQQA